MKKIISAVVVVAFLAVGLLVTSAPAQAVSYSGCYNYNPGKGSNGSYIWENYNWYEETFLGKRDRWVYRNGIFCV